MPRFLREISGQDTELADRFCLRYETVHLIYGFLHGLTIFGYTEASRMLIVLGNPICSNWSGRESKSSVTSADTNARQLG